MRLAFCLYNCLQNDSKQFRMLTNLFLRAYRLRQLDSTLMAIALPLFPSQPHGFLTLLRHAH